ncbi:hypothetical protein SteCoe_7457 [Stentor coeruleus]|uniref:Actin n=1 Tax=Stentor coeruleus TaxID=5963 RepID=A0A1R2CMK9_9CILI|nr:hypothetical protein SteCoe_7457 [Stentor coeruleus]
MISLVLDNGSGVCKIGFTGDDYPKVYFQSVINNPNTYENLISSKHQNLIYPINHGIITNWDDITLIWEKAFNKLNINPSHHPILLTESPLNPQQNTEKMIETIYETFNIPSSQIFASSVLSFYSSGRASGLSFDSGDGVTCAVPIIQGYALSHAIKRINFAGRDITDILYKLLINKGYYLDNIKIVRKIKEKICYISLDYNKEINKNIENILEKYELPDGRSLSIGDERFKATEWVFQPRNFGFDIDGVDEMVYKSIMKCNDDVRRVLFGNVVITGGSTMISGFGERFSKEICNKATGNMRVKVISLPERSFSTWIGGSILSSLSSFQNNWVTKDEYYENGISAVYRKYNLLKS